MHDRLSEQIATLPALNKAQLLAIWAENFSKDPPPNLRKELMVPILAYQIQERPVAVIAWFFLEADFGVFAGGFWRKRVVEVGFLVVNLWWNRGDLWCADGHFSKVENFPLFDDLFFGFPFWEWGVGLVRGSRPESSPG